MDATPVGRIECVGKQVGCDAPLTSADQSDLQPLVVTDYPDLTPMWTHEVPGDSRFASALLIDSDGTWTGECAKQAEGDLCQVDEVLVFEGTGAAPRRFPFTATTVQENEGKLSFWWVSSDQHPHIDRLNTNGDVLWRQTGTLGPDGWQLQGVGLPDYKLAAVMYNQHDPSDQQQLWVLDSQGNFASRVGIGPLSQFEKLLADTKGNLSLVASSQDGDLIMSKLGVSGVFSGVSLQREEWTVTNRCLLQSMHS